jgi:hypothetical protein
MQILDLSYLCNTSETDLIVGSVGATVDSNAFATGSRAKTYALADTFSTKLQNGGAIALGIGKAVATGSNLKASVKVAGEGDLVLEIEGSKYLVCKNTAIALGIVIAIDFPDKKG